MGQSAGPTHWRVPASSLSGISVWMAPRYPGDLYFCPPPAGSLGPSSLDKGPGHRDTMGGHQGDRLRSKNEWVPSSLKRRLQHCQG